MMNFVNQSQRNVRLCKKRNTLRYETDTQAYAIAAESTYLQDTGILKGIAAAED